MKSNETVLSEVQLETSNVEADIAEITKQLEGVGSIAAILFFLQAGIFFGRNANRSGEDFNEVTVVIKTAGSAGSGNGHAFLSRDMWEKLHEIIST